ncbi:KR domain-containing protein [Nemania serpens]|nr:KR domain-containing protein [Nemania serpens]
MECVANVVSCNISDAKEVESIVTEYAQKYTIKGIVHAAVTLADLSFHKLKFAQWRLGLEAKVSGTVNLHEVTKDLPLDFFTMVTSLSTILAPATQGAYTAANNVQAIFARYRRKLGLKASALSCGFVTDVGPLSTDDTARALMARIHILGMTEREFLRLLEIAILDDSISRDVRRDTENWLGIYEDPFSSSGIITCLDPQGMADERRKREDEGHIFSNITPRWHSDPRVSHIMRGVADAAQHRQDGIDGAHVGDDVDVQVRDIFNDAIAKGPLIRADTETVVTNAIVGTVAKLLLIENSDVNANRTIADYGVDSLIATELRNWIYKSFGVDISMVDLLDTNVSMKNLARMIVDSALAGKETKTESA